MKSSDYIRVQKIVRTYPSYVRLNDTLDVTDPCKELNYLLSRGYEVIMCNPVTCNNALTYEGHDQVCLEYILQGYELSNEEGEQYD